MDLSFSFPSKGLLNVNQPNQLAYQQAIRDFRSARDRAMLEIVLDRLTGQPSQLLSYEDVRKKLRASGTAPRGLQDIPLDSIVGSVGRYTDFTRSFLPRERSDEQRWARVKAVAEGLEGMPPIEVYQLGDAYFVRDGHHRVSVARQVGAKTIEAYVTEVKSRVALSKNDDPRRLIVKEEMTDFLQTTGLDYIRPESNIELTEPGQFPELRARIEFHHQQLEQERGQPVELSQAVADWYDRVYLPVVHVIRQQGMLRDFPERTEADLYMWLMDHSRQLAQHLGWEVGMDQAAADLAEHHSQRPGRRAEQLGERIIEALIPDELESGPPAGDWRRQVVARREEKRLFRDILVAVRDDQAGWQVLEQAVHLARRDGSRVLGLHVASYGHRFGQGKAEELSHTFNDRCQQAGVQGRFVIDRGRVTEVISRRARWTDLVILSLKHPPAEDRLARLGSGLRRLIRSCPRPIMMVPGSARDLTRILVAYDGSPKAREALYIGSYMASAWQVDLRVITVEEEGFPADQVQAEAAAYLNSNGNAAPVDVVQGETSHAILECSRRWQTDLLLVGGYGASPVVEAVLGSTVDEVLRQLDIPILVCR